MMNDTPKLTNEVVFDHVSKSFGQNTPLRDISFTVPIDVTFAALSERVSVTAGRLLQQLSAFDVYQGKGVELGRKSIALGLILQDSSRTLTDVDADAVVTAVVTRLRDVLSATIRDQ